MITPRSRTATRPLLAVLGAFVLLSGLLPMARISTADAAGPNVDLTALDVAYTQSFDTLPATGSATWINDSTIPGWFHARTGTGLPTIVANNGGSNAGSLYSYGTGTATDRALGSIGSTNASVLDMFWGVRLFNGTGGTITSLDVSYTGEQWRNSAAVAQTVSFSYLVGSPSVAGTLAEFLSAGTAVTGLDFTSPITGGIAGALDGNAAANRTSRSATISDLSIPPGTEIMLRWFDDEHTGSDHGLSIDDFTVTPHGVVGTTLGIDDVSLDEGNAGTTAYAFTVSLSAPAPVGGVTFDIATANDSATEPSDYTAKSLTTQTIPEDSSTYTFTVQVNGDATAESDEQFLVNVSNVTGATVADGNGAGSIQNDDAATVLIHDVQGNGAATPIAGTTVTIEGVVVGDFQTVGTGQLRGFFLQEEDADVDANPATSEGIFVFCNTCPTAVAEGDRVQATGVVSEFFGMTQITASTAGSVAVISTGDTVTASSIDLPVVGDINTFYEAREGMKVTFTDTLTVSEYFELARYGQVILYEGGRPEQFTEADAPSVPGFAAHLDQLARREVILDDDNNLQNLNPTQPDGSQFIYHPSANGEFGVGTQGTDFFRGGDTISSLTGVLHWSFAGQTGTDAWRIRPTAADPQRSPPSTRALPRLPWSAAPIKAVSMNLLNYFTTIDTTSSNNTGLCGPSGTLDCRGADSAAELDRQRERASIVICDLNADVYGFMELENSASATITDLLGAVNTRCGGAHPYTLVDTGGTLGTDAIRVQLIYRGGILSPIEAPMTDLDPIHNRPPTAQTFDVVDLTNVAFGERFTVVANHFKSKGCDDAATGPDADAGDGQSCYNGRRTDQASRLLNWINATVVPEAGDPDVLLLGDFNSYSKEQPVTTIKAGGYTDLAESLDPGSYSYLFDGQLGHLDYAFASSSLVSQVTGVGSWHINADEIPLFDYNDEIRDTGEASFEEKPDGSALVPPRVVFQPASRYRASDHDPVIVGLFTDTTGPDTTIDTSPPIRTNSVDATFTFSGTDNATPPGDLRFECRVDTEDFADCTSPATFFDLVEGAHSFDVRAIDAAANVDPSPAHFEWIIDTTPPTVTIDQATGQPDPTETSPINFTVVFDEVVSDFGDADVTLSGTAGATTAVVTGGPSTYNVAVSGMSGDGTVIATIEAGAATDLAGNSNAVSTSIDNTVTFVVNGAPTATVTDGACPTVKDVTGSLTFGLSDPDGDPLTFTFFSNTNTTLVPNASIAIGGSGNSPTVTVAAANKQSGTASLTFHVSDGDETVPVVVTVNVGTNKNDTLAGTEGTDMIFGVEGMDTINGLGGNDLLCGGVGDDTIDGGAGNDVIGGAGGNDSIDGDLGNDILRGDSGADSLTGGAGEDAFSGGQGIDAATDFDAGEGDTQDGSIP